MQRPDFIALGPMLILSAFATVIMVMIAVKRHHATTLALSLIGLLASLGAVILAIPNSRTVTPLLIIDGYALFYMGLILVTTLATVTLSYDYLKRQCDVAEEFYLLVLLAALGSMVLVAARHMASFFLGLEILSVSLYALIAYTRKRNASIEAGLKYLVLAAVSVVFFLFGVALIYADTGHMDFQNLGLVILNSPHHSLVFLTGLAFLVVAIGFKLAVTPFHMWTPDIYQGAPAPVSAFVATASKGAISALLVRMFTPVDLAQCSSLFAIFAILSIASMVAGNLMALMQTNIKRLLAYSSIAHMGYMLTAFLASGKDSATVITFYLAAYAISVMGCFGVVTLLSAKGSDADSITDIKGLFYTHPWLTGVFTAMLLSLAGIPLTAGFMGKFFVVATGVKSANWWLVLTLVLTSGVGLFYYLKLIVAMFSKPDTSDVPERPALSSMGVMALSVLSVLLLWLGITPAWFSTLIRNMVG